MGAIVGALYASGLSPDEIVATIEEKDWKGIFQGTPSRKRVHFRRKQDDRLPLLPLELGVGRGGLKTVSGLVSDQQIRFTLRQLTLHTIDLAHFDDLPIPFRAVAADLADGSAVVLEDGSLAEAMRASMAVPGVFAPVHRDGQQLVDGGIAANMPVEIAYELGAERVIAVDLDHSIPARKNDTDVVSVLYQTLGLLTSRNVATSRLHLRPSDALIQPDLDDLTSTDFGRLSEAVAMGEAAVPELPDALRDYVVSEAEYADFLNRQRRSSGQESEILIDQVSIDPSDRVDARQIEHRIRAEAGSTLDLEALGEDLSSVYQIGEFAHVDFEIEPTATGNHLNIELEDKTWGPGYLRPGLTFSANLEGDSDFLALLNYRKAQLNARGAEWQTVLTIGDRNSIYSELFQPLDFDGRWFVRPYLQLLEDQFFDPTGEAGGLDAEGLTAGIDLGIHFRNVAELRVGLEYTGLDVTSTEIGKIEGDVGGVRLGLTVDQLDDVAFPRSGTFVSFDLLLASEDLGTEVDYERLEVEWIQSWSFGVHTLLGRLRYGTSFGSPVPVTDDFELGGFSNLSGYQQRELRGDALGFVSLGYYRQLGKLYLGGQVEAGNAWDRREDASLDDLIGSLLLFAGRDTLIGPLYLGYGLAEGRDSFYLFLGQTF